LHDGRLLKSTLDKTCQNDRKTKQKKEKKESTCLPIKCISVGVWQALRHCIQKLVLAHDTTATSSSKVSPLQSPCRGELRKHQYLVVEDRSQLSDVAQHDRVRVQVDCFGEPYWGGGCS
jgi:hypothetical protein